MYHTEKLPPNNYDDLKDRGQQHFVTLPNPRGLQSTKTVADLWKAVKPGGNERIIGDLHWFDPNIIQMVPRPFESVEEMNEYMIDQWNSVAEDDDTVFVNGDFIDFNNCTKEQGYTIIDRLKGRRIILILGNHDRPHIQTLKEYGPRLEVIEYPILKDDFWIISHEPQYVSDAAPYANIFAHVHLNPMYRDVSSRSFCTSAERLGYRPILLSEAMDAVRNYKEYK